MLVPPINARGKFTVQPPFDNLLSEFKEYTVTAIRSLQELEDSNENPLANIYTALSLTENDYNNDLNANVPIVVLRDTSDSYVYIPANKIIGIPAVSGYKYQEKVLGISLGAIPIDENLNSIINDITDIIKDNLGVITNIKIVDSSAVILIDETEHKTYLTKRNSNRAGNSDSFRTKYFKCREREEALSLKNENLVCYIKQKENN